MTLYNSVNNSTGTNILCNSTKYLKASTETIELDKYGNPKNYRDAMLHLLSKIKQYVVNSNHPSFCLINNGGVGIFGEDTDHNWTKGKISKLASIIDAVTIEDYYYGCNANWDMTDNEASPNSVRESFDPYLNEAIKLGIKPMIIDYCSDKNKIQDSWTKCSSRNFANCIATNRNLCEIPDYQGINVTNNNAIYDIHKIKNFMTLLNPNPDINPPPFSDKADYISQLAATNYDALVIDQTFAGEYLTAKDLAVLHRKPNGKRRLVLSYMSLGEAEDYRPYWKEEWNENKPKWIDELNPDWAGNYKVKYWMEEWEKILFGSSDACLDTIMNNGFDGVFLDVIDAYEYFEQKR